MSGGLCPPIFLCMYLEPEQAKTECWAPGAVPTVMHMQRESVITVDQQLDTDANAAAASSNVLVQNVSDLWSVSDTVLY